RHRLRHADRGRGDGPQARELVVLGEIAGSDFARHHPGCAGAFCMPGKLILVRHGQSDWNLENLFTGWPDVDLPAQGRAEAAQAGRELLQERLAVDIAFTSVL